MDLPMPGSPPTSVTDPGTRPPPSTLSSSGMPVGRAAHEPVSTSAIGTALAIGVSRRWVSASARARSTTSSTSVSHPPQPGHRPAHLADSAPHSPHRWTVLSLVMTCLAPSCDGGYAGGATVPRTPTLMSP